tara:strand:+ start:1009 stop:1299 length:291 start_codon:yes stop_codon:yes gene_type:complete
MTTIIQTTNIFAFAFMAYVLTGVLLEALKGSQILKPAAMTVCSITIAYHLYHAGVQEYILASFVGFFFHACANAYTKKEKAGGKPNKRKPSVKINP